MVLIDDDIQKRKGYFIIEKEVLYSMTERQLKLLYSKIYPFLIEFNNDYSLGTSMKVYCVCAAFDILEDGCIIPHYEIIMNESCNKISVKLWN